MLIPGFPDFDFGREGITVPCLTVGGGLEGGAGGGAGEGLGGDLGGGAGGGAGNGFEGRVGCGDLYCDKSFT